MPYIKVSSGNNPSASTGSRIKSNYMTADHDPNSPWNAGKNEQWTSSRVLGNIYKLYDLDPDRARKMYSDFKYLQTDPSSKYYNPYSMPTNKSVGRLAQYGIDTSNIDDAWYDRYSYLTQYLKYDGTTNTPTKPGKKASVEEQAAYEYFQIWKSKDATNRARNQWDALQKEVTHYAQSDRNYSDDEILGMIDWSKYGELSSMDKNGTIQPNEYNAPIGYSKDALHGVIWQARNPEYTGDLEGAMAYSYLGRGNQYQYNPEIAAMLNPYDEEGNVNTKFLPYALGGTNLDDDAIFFGVQSFPEGWTEENKWMRSSGTPEQKEHFDRVYAAEQNWQSGKKAIDTLYDYLNTFVADGKSSDKVIEKLDNALKNGKIYIKVDENGNTKYSTVERKGYEAVDLSVLNQMDLSVGKNGSDPVPEKIVPMTRGLNYKYDNLVKQITETCAANDAARVSEADTSNSIVADAERIGTGNAKDIDAVSGADQFIRPTGQGTSQPVRSGDQVIEPTEQGSGQPAKSTGEKDSGNGKIVRWTETDLTAIDEKNEKISEAAETAGDAFSDNEKTVFKYGSSVIFNQSRSNFTLMRTEERMLQALTDRSVDIASASFIETGIDTAHNIASYRALVADNTANKERVEELKAQYGNMELLSKEFEPHVDVQVGDFTISLNAVQAPEYGHYRYEIFNIAAPGRNILSSDELSNYDFAGEIFAQARQIANEKTAEANAILAAQRNAEKQNKDWRKDLEEYNLLIGRISEQDTAIENGAEKNAEDEAALRKYAEQLNMMYESATLQGLDTSKIDEAWDFMNGILEFHYEPKLPEDSQTKLGYIKDIEKTTGKTYTTDQRSELLHDSIDSIDADIEKIKKLYEYAERTGTKIPARYDQNMQYTLQDLEYERQAFEYSTILTDTDPEELAAAIAAGKAFEEKYADNMLTFQTMYATEEDGISPEYYFTLGKKNSALANDEGQWFPFISDEDRDIYYYLLGKKIQENGEAFDDLWENNPMSLETKDLLTDIMKDAEGYVEFMTDEDYGAWITKRAENVRQHAQEMVDSGFGGGLLVNLASTFVTPAESVANFFGTVDQMINGGRINTNATSRLASIYKEGTREATFKSIDDVFADNPTARWFARLGYEIYSNRGDSLMNSMFFGALMPNVPNAILNELLGAAPMGITAATNAAAEAIENGASTEQAWWIFGWTFAAETVTEAVTYSNIQEALGVTEELSKESLKQFAIDWLTKSGVEEMIGESTNDVVENWANRAATELFDNPNYESDHQKLIDEFYAQGYTKPGEAEAKAYEQEVKNIVHTAFVSYVSAGSDILVKAGKAAVNKARNAAEVVNGYRTYTKGRQKLGYGDSMLDYMRRDFRNRNNPSVGVAPQMNTQASEQEAGTAVPSETSTAPATAEMETTGTDLNAVYQNARLEYDKAYKDERQKRRDLTKARKELSEAQKSGNQERINAAKASVESAQQEYNASKQAKEDARTSRNEASAALEKAEQVRVAKEATPEQKQAAADVAAVQRVSKSTPTTQTEMIASILDNGDGDETTTEQANAAATYLQPLLGDDCSYFVQQVMMGTARTGVSREVVTTALMNAALGNGAATALVQSDAFRNASVEQKAQMLAETVEQDQSNPEVQRNIADKVKDYRIAIGMSEQAANGHFDQAAKSREDANKAAANTAEARTQLEEKQDAAEAAQGDFESKDEEFRNNPQDKNLLKERQDSLSRRDRADESQHQYEQHLANEEEAQKEAEAKADKDAADATNAARDIARENVAAQDQQRTEKQNRIDEEKQYKQDLMDNGIITREVETDADNLFASDEEMEERNRAHFSYGDGTIQYHGPIDENMARSLEEAGFTKETVYDMETGEKREVYVADRNNVSIDTLKTLNDSVNAQQDQLTGKTQEDEENSKIDAFVDSSTLSDDEKADLKKRLKDRNERIKSGKIDLSGKLTDAQSMLALGALQRKLGVPILFSDSEELGNADGMYSSKEGVIYLNSRKAKDGSLRLGRALLEVAMHEITHSLEQTKHYQQYRQIVLNTLFGKGDQFDQVAYDLAIKQKQDLYKKNGENLTTEQAEKEIIADFAKMRLSEKDVVQRFMDAGMGGKMRNMLHNINQALKNFFGNMSGEDRLAAENLRKAERAFQKALNERARTAVHPGADQFSIAQFAQSTNMTYDEKTQTLRMEDGTVIDGVNHKVTPDMIRSTPVGKLIDVGLENDQKQAALDMFSGLMNMIAMLKDNNLVWEIASGTLESTFSALKANSDTQYHDTIDFGTICAKTQAIVNVMSEVMLDRLKANDIARQEGRYEDVSYGLTRDDVLKIYNETHKAGLSVPCPVCYVFSHWMGVPSLLGQMSRFQHDYIVTGKDADGKDIHYGDGEIVMDENGYATFDPVETEKAAKAYIEKMHGLYGDKDGVDARKTKINSEINKGEKRHTKLAADIEALENQLKNENLKPRSREAAEKKLAAARAEIEQNAVNISKLDEELREVEAYNWITQSLMTTDENGEYVIDPEFQITPDEVLLDMRRTGEFSDRYAKNWAYRTSRGAGMGKSILPYSGASLGDVIMGKQTRVATEDNPLFNGTSEEAMKAVDSARDRAKRQNLIGGQRLQSTSDFRPEWGLDYIMAFLELQAAKSNAQMYTKVAEAVDLFASAGADVNLSIMGSGNGFHEATAEELARMTDAQKAAATVDGKVYVMDFSNVTGMRYFDEVDENGNVVQYGARHYSQKYDNVQMILVGMNDVHIRLALAGDEIDFVIPWHSSGNSREVLSQLVSSVEETLNTSSDYTNTQGDKFVSRKERYIDEATGKRKTRTVDARTDEQKTMWNARIKILTGIAQKAVNTEDSSKGGLTEAEKQYVIGDKANPYLKDLYERFYLKEGDKCFGVALTSAQAKQIFPYEYWQTDVTKPGGTKETADENGRRFIEYCQAMGVVPRFSGVWDAKNKKVKNGNFAGAVYDSSGKITGYDPSKMQKGYWKLLIDRKMYDLNGNYREQKQIDVSGIQIGGVEGEGSNAHLSDSMLPTETSAKYGIPALERQAAEASERLIRKPFDLSGTQMLYSDNFSDAELDDMLRQAGVDYQSAMENGDTVSAQDSLDYIRQYNPDLAIDTEYMYAVNHGDMETAQRLVNEQAEAKKAEVFAATDVPAYRIRRGYEPKRTVTVYKTFTLDEQGRPSALFVSSKNPLPVGVWLDAQDTYHFTSTKNGRMYVPSTKNPNTKGGATGTPINLSDISEADLAELERLGHIKKNENGEWSAKSLTSLAYRPGWHAGDMPFFPQGGMKIEGTNYENVHRYNQVVFECEMAADEDYTSYDIRDDGTVVYHDRQEMPENGSYKFATNPMANAQDIGAWYISGALKINRALTEAECNEILAENGRAPQEWQKYQDSDELKSIKGKEGKYEYEHTVGPLDLDALGYDPTQNDGGKKLLDPVTYDDNGNIIPLSKRFDKSKQDPRYSFGDQSNMTDSELDDLLRRAGVKAPTQDEIDSYQQKTSRPLEGKSVRWSQEEGPAQRQFGGENGMLQESDEIAQQAIDYVQAHNAYFPDTNEDQIVRAINWIRKNGSERGEDGSLTQKTDGYYESVKKVTSKTFDYRSADGQARMIATMAMAVAKNDVAAQVELADAFNRQGTDLGRALQARKLFRLMTPEGRIASLQKMMQNTADELGAKGINADLKFSDWIYRAAAAAVDEADFRKVQQAAAVEIASQIPANWRDKFRSWRMLSMLGNPRTHIRNIIGNAFFVPVVSMKNKLGAIGETIMGVEKGQRTKTLSLVLPSEIREFALQDAIAMKDTLTGEAKFNESNMVQQEQKAFTGLLQALIDFNSDRLEAEDWHFLRNHYRRALGGWMQANGYTADQLRSDPALLEQGRAYAVQEAQKATYRDFNKLAATLNKVSREGGVAGFITDAVLPFKKTPANILRRGVEYSPVGIMKSITSDLYHLKQYKDYQNGKLSVMPEKAISPTQFIDHLCSGLAGTAIMAVGALLGNAGIVSCGLDDDDDEFEKAKGNQKYALKFSIAGHDFTFTMDWAAPMSMPFFVGAAIQEQMSSGVGFDIEELVNAFGNITEPVFNLSMLDGVNTLFKTSQYDDTNTLTQIGAKIASNYATSYVPSLLGAIARTIDDKQRKSFVESGKGTGVMGSFRYAAEQTENKIPWLNQTNIPMRDIWGNENTSSLAERILENFILPGYINEYRNDPIIDEMARLWEATGDKALVPDADPDKTITYNKQKHVLTAEQWDLYKESRNKTAHEMLTRLIESEDYQNATDAAQAQMIKNIWSYADKIGKQAVFPDYEVEEKGDPVAKATLEGKVTARKTDMMTALETGDYDGYDAMVEALHELGVEDSEIKTKIGNTYRDQYKEAYRKGDEAKMAEIEDILDNTGFDFDIDKWEEQVDEKYGQ